MAKTQYCCRACGATAPKWAGQCVDCQAWNTLDELTLPSNTRRGGYAGTAAASVKLHEVALAETPRTATQIAELDRVLGGGIVAGSVILVGGDPGIGKSTLLLQTMAALDQQCACVYVTGEESLQQVALRAKRLELAPENLTLLAETQIETILASLKKADMVVIDSIQTIHTDALSSAPGSVGQVRESAARLVRFAKQNDTAILLVGHVTKEGAIAGPRVLEHMVDTVLAFDSTPGSRFRMLRATKNRFGAVNEMGVFAMDERGLRGVTNPSAIFLSRHSQPVAGSAIMSALEGTRPLLLELQVLAEETHGGQARRLAVGMDAQRLAMLLAVLHRHAGISMFDQDIYANAVGGVRLQETAGDLPFLLAAVSSLRNRPIANDTLIFGEVGLTGEVRPVPEGQLRLREAAGQGFKRAIIPYANRPRPDVAGLQVHAVERITDALELI